MRLHFMEHAREWLPEPLEALCIETDPNYPGGFGKVVDGSTTLIEREHSDYVGGNSDNWRKIWTIYTFLVWYEEYFVKR